MKNIFLAFFLFSLVSCAVTEGALFSSDMCRQEGMGLVTFYREPGFAGSGLVPMVQIDGEQVSGIPKGGYISLIIPPGEYKLELVDNKQDMAAWRKSENIDATISIKADTEDYFEFVVKRWSAGFLVPVGHTVLLTGGSRESAILQADKAQAMQKLTELRGKTLVVKVDNGKIDSVSLADCGQSPTQLNDDFDLIDY